MWAGRIPRRVGEPAGGSLTADEYKFAATGPWPIIVCIFLLNPEYYSNCIYRFHAYGIAS
jgi:hypothetical protein